MTVDIAAKSPDEVKMLVRRVRRCIEQYMGRLYSQGAETPMLVSLQSDGIAWDWMKPCYYSHLIYQCITPTDI